MMPSRQTLQRSQLKANTSRKASWASREHHASGAAETVMGATVVNAAKKATAQTRSKVVSAPNQRQRFSLTR